MSEPEYDIIFAGGGTAACVAAGRLAAAAPTLKILVVERGQHSRNLPIHVQPCRFVENLAQGSTTVTRHQAKKTEYLDTATVVPSGRCIGGGSAVNFMVYVRGAQSDYDDWEALGNKGWGYEDVLPLFQKFENFTPIPDLPTHGYNGPVQISRGGTGCEVGKSLLVIAKKYNPSRPVVPDCNDFKTSDAYCTYYKYINADDGKRSDAASRYLYPHYSNDNTSLKILVGKHVERVIFENECAIGIEYTEEGTSGTPVIVAKAKKLVVLSAGAFGSPAILERSGIGAESILEANNVSLIVDLPGVGEEYHDHPSAILVNYAADDTETLDDVWRKPEEAIDQYEHTWETTGKGKIAANGIDAIVKWRPTEEDLKVLGPDFEPYWGSFYKEKTDKAIGMLASVAGLPRAGAMETTKKFITMAYNTLYPEGVGSVHIKPGETAEDRLDFDPGFLSKKSDVALLTWMYKKSRELGRRLPFYKGEVLDYHPNFPSGSAASAKETDEPVDADAPDIEYTKEDDDAIIAFHRAKVQTTWHSLGTCAMKPQQQGGVVDERLNVYGVKGLKVADLSICPTNVGNNTNSTALMIGEKAATIIAEELGIDLK
ncbi:hypothetical protein JVU11DRAFT_3754 [Chiua virens]|nr:hypothetical protein JVU11DRAFT_3754 [Chiua virens]